MQVDASLEARVASMVGGDVVRGTKSDLSEKSIVDLSENVFVKDDVIEFPATMEELQKVLLKETYTGITNARGEHPTGNYVVLPVTNGNTTTIKKFRFTTPVRSFAEYKYDEANDAYVATGRTVAPQSPLVNALKPMRNELQIAQHLLGKKIKCVDKVWGIAARTENQQVKSIYRRELPVFDYAV